MYPEYETKKKVNGGAVARIVIWSVALVLLVGVFVCAMVIGGGFINLGGYVYPEETTGFEATVDAVSGTVRVHDFDGVTQTKDYCRFGDGSVKINVDAVSGNLKIDKNLHG